MNANENASLEIDPTTDHALRVAVERVVRPVHAEESRKLRMRGELFAHALEAYQDERARGRDPSAARDAAIARVGDPADLTAELQAGVPWSSRWGATVDRFIRRRPETPRWRYALCTAGSAMAGFAALFVLIGLLAIFEIGKPHPLWRPEVQRFLLFGALMIFMTGCLGSYFASLVRDTLAGASSSLAAAIGWAALGAVLIGSMGLLLWPIVGAPGVMWSPQFTFSWLTLSALAAIAMVAISQLDIRERRGLQDWLALEVD